jgi:hypothetical protein
VAGGTAGQALLPGGSGNGPAEPAVPTPAVPPATAGLVLPPVGLPPASAGTQLATTRPVAPVGDTAAPVEEPTAPAADEPGPVALSASSPWFRRSVGQAGVACITALWLLQRLAGGTAPAGRGKQVISTSASLRC